MFTGIVLLILGILLVGFSFRCIFRVKKEMDDDTAGGIIMIFVVGAILMYSGAEQMDKFSCPQPETTKSDLR